MRGAAVAVTIIAGIIAVLALADAGPFGGDDESGGVGSAAFAAEANAICRDAIEAVGASARRNLRSGGSAAAERRYLRAAARVYDSALARIAALEPPREEAGEVARLLDAGRAGVARVRSAGGVEEVAGARDPFTRFNALATAVGLPDCAR